MSDEIQYLHEELESITKELEKAIKELEKKKLKPDVKADKISHVQDRVQRGKDIYANFRVELRDVLKESGRVAFTEWEGKGHTHHKNMTKFTKDIENISQRADEEEAKLRNGPVKRDKKDANTWKANEIIAEGQKVQDQSSAALSRTQKLVEQAEQMGQDTNVKIQTQTEQMKNTNADVVGVDQRLKRADKLIQQILRRLATDKIIMCMVLILILAILALIILKSTNMLGGGAEGDSGEPIDCSLDITKTNRQCIAERDKAAAAAAAAGTTTVGGGRRSSRDGSSVQPVLRGGSVENGGGGGRSRAGQEALARLAETWGRGSKAGVGFKGRVNRGSGSESSLGAEFERAVEVLLRSLL